jgi:hypothetical protein
MRRHAATAVVLALLVGTAVAFAETERLKLKPTPIEESFVQPAFSPDCDCDLARAEIRLRLHEADKATVSILDAEDRVVTTLVDAKPLPSGRTVLHWDGRGAPDGRYRVDVYLADADRTFRLPRPIVLDTVAPTARVVSYRDTVAPGQKVRVVYRLSEPAHAVLFANGKRVILTHTKLRSAQFDWRPKRKGRYELELAGVDLAGNLGPRTPVFMVTVA